MSQTLANSFPSARVAREGLAEGLAAQLVRWSERLGQSDSSDAALLARLAQELALSACDGNVCLPLAGLPGMDAAEARRALLASGVAAEAVSRVLAATAFPLVLDGENLYLRVFFDFEVHVARALKTLSQPLPMDDARLARCRAALDSVFPPREGVDWQRAAAALALTRRLTIVSGGPGTGKTTTVAALIACLTELEPDLRIALAAPTGKAATRLREALAARTRDFPAAARARLPTEAHTLHRLLGASATGRHFRHDAANPLALDLLVVDEASMLDIALAAALFDALPPHARLVLLGDKDQLAAVEAGAVFAELSSGWRFSEDESARLAPLAGIPAEALMRGAGREAALPDSVIWLLESHRFRADSGIGRLAREINAAGEGGGAAAIGWLRTQPDPAVSWLEDDPAPFPSGGSPLPDLPPSAAALAAMEEGYAAYFDALREISPDEPFDARALRVFAAFERFRVLVAVREGARGLAAANAYLERHARNALGIPASVGAFWAGRPVIVLENDAITRLFNGDIGLCLPDSEGRMGVVFPAPGGGIRIVPPSRLPAHDTAFALTVHKSQGSEFAEVLLLLPARPVRVLTRELLYTAVTRAARRVSIAGSAEVFESGCAMRSARFGGLGNALRGSSQNQNAGG